MWIDFVVAVVPALLVGLTTGLLVGRRIGSGITFLIIAALIVLSLSDWTTVRWMNQFYSYPVLGPFAAGLAIGKAASWLRKPEKI